MIELIALVVAAFSIVVVVLPIWTFFRMHRMSTEVRSLARRIEELERGVHATPSRPVREARPAHTGQAHEEESVIPPAVPVRSEVHPSAGPVAAAGVATSSLDHDRVSATAGDPVLRSGAETRDFEGEVGGRWLLYVGVLTLLLGVSFFLKYAFENEWVGPWGRVTLGLFAGGALIAGGRSLDRGGLAAFGRALAGTGLAVLYLSIYAALSFYALIDQTLAFALMAGVTALAGWLADRTAAQSLAVLGVGGGFLTPFLIGGANNAQTTLFTYDALLVLGTLLIARRHAWPGLNALAYVLTSVTLAAWADEYYTDDQWIPTLFFLTVFCILFVAVLPETRRAPGLLARLVAALLWTAPGLYHLFALVITSDHPPAFHVYLIVFTLAGLLLAASPPRPWLRLVVLLATLAPLFGYLLLPEGPSWLVANLVTVAAVCGLHLMVLVERVWRRDEELSLADLLALHLAGLGLFGLMQRTLSGAFPGMGGTVALGAAALAGALWTAFRIRDRVAALNAAALAFTLVAVAITLQFDGRVVVMGWAAEGAAIAWLGLRVPSGPFVAGGLALWSAAALRLVDGYFETPVNFTALVNERSLATIGVIALGYALVGAVRRAAPPPPLARETRVALHVACSALTLLWISAEIRSYWQVRYETPQAYLYEQLMLSLGWALYGAGSIALGMLRAYAPLRYIGITVIGVTVLKVFFVDLWDLGGIYRVIGFLSLGILLVLVSYLYQKRTRAPAL